MGEKRSRAYNIRKYILAIFKMMDENLERPKWIVTGFIFNLFVYYFKNWEKDYNQQENHTYTKDIFRVIMKFYENMCYFFP